MELLTPTFAIVDQKSHPIHKPENKHHTEDKPYERTLLERPAFTDSDLKCTLKSSRLILEKEHPAENLWRLHFTNEVSGENIESEVKRLVASYGLTKASMINTDLNKGLIFTADESKARQLSRDSKVRRIFQGRRFLPAKRE